MKKFLLALLAFISISCPVFASDWVYLGKNRDGQLIYLDKDSVIESYGEVAGWQKNVKSDGSWVLYRVSVQERNQSIAITSCVVYDAEGNVVDQYTSPIPIYNPVVPDSVGEGVYNFLVEIAKSNV